ncbi:DUF3793 family protein [Clostridium sp. AM33-3]|uniref:DUF3793 family protein n=1 Tax=Clostridium sp. AM33-3 TaxID=2292304 RepID=UPI000E4CB9A3|nr:DUF3793 family protein [Clostridium sp. AM33-3]RHT22622.1 DUF3793 family protein [Clostridium sp. AM33-3]
MSAETMLHFLNNCTPEEKFGFRVVTQCAPVLKGVKISNLITMKPGGWRKIRAYLKKSRIICIPLYADAEKEVLFLYRYEQLERHLKNREVREFLRGCGYESFEVASVLVRLRRRYRLYAGISKEFPHELGVLLGYPVGDVQGFIDNRGENSLTSRYWKVYQNPKEAERIFDLYDRVKEQALKEIMCGRTLSHVAVS